MFMEILTDDNRVIRADDKNFEYEPFASEQISQAKDEPEADCLVCAASSIYDAFCPNPKCRTKRLQAAQTTELPAPVPSLTDYLQSKWFYLAGIIFMLLLLLYVAVTA